MPGHLREREIGRFITREPNAQDHWGDIFVCWFTAGVLSAVNRLAQGSTQEDYFTAFVNELSASAGPGMHEFFELFHARYELLPVARQMAFTGPFVGLDVRAPVDLAQRMKPLDGVFSAEGEAVARYLVTAGGLRFDLASLPGRFPEPAPAADVPNEKGPSITIVNKAVDAPAAVPAAAQPCCERLGINLESIHVIEPTRPRALDDDVYVRGAQTGGPHIVVGAKPFHYPLDANGDPTMVSWGRGEGDSPDVPIVVVEPGVNECWAGLGVALTFWEGDWGDFATALRASVSTYMSSAAVGLMQMPLVVPAAGAIEKLAANLLKLLGLDDDPMGYFGLAVKARPFHRRPIRDFMWSPSIAAITAPAEVKLLPDKAPDYVRFSKNLSGGGGEWEVVVKVWMTCS